MTKAGNKLFGKVNSTTKRGEGSMGSREYQWVIKVHDLNGYRLLTPEEEELFNTIIKNYYSSNPDKIKRAAMLEEEYKKSKTMTKEEYFLQKDSMGLDLFADALRLFKEQTGETIVCCSQYEINAWIETPEENKN